MRFDGIESSKNVMKDLTIKHIYIYIYIYKRGHFSMV